MSDQLELYPSGLTRTQFDRLSTYAGRAAGLVPSQLLQEAQRHLDRARVAHSHNHLVNVRLATAICEIFAEVVNRWESLAPHAWTWLAGAFLYFAKRDDDEPDFRSPIGFEDDAEVLNACLRLAHLDELSLRPEDYDDV
jgi:uncharacterized membrane protein YkvA (DUF1232 family)